MDLDPIYKASIQKALNERANQSLAPDGVFGLKTVSAIKAYQALNKLPLSGTYDVATANLLDPFIRQKFLTFNSILKASVDLNVSAAHVRTVCDVESNGSGFFADGRVKILFERHHFLKALQARYSAAKVAELMKQNPDIISATSGGYLVGANEYMRFDRACKIDQQAAIYATSFGLFQIMGFNHEFAGFSDMSSFYNAMLQSETNHLNAFVSFNKKYVKGRLQAYLAKEDWANYALTYNGPAYAKNKYDTKLATSYAKYKKDVYAF